MSKINYTILRGLLALSIMGCTLSCSTETKILEKQKVLRHVVSFQFKEEIPAERREQAVKDFLALKDEIPGIESFEGGEDISVEGLNKGFTHCFILTFENEVARDVYIPHPAHEKLAEKNKPLMKDLVVMDVWGEK